MLKTKFEHKPFKRKTKMPICWTARCISVFGLYLSFKSCIICCKPSWSGCYAILLFCTGSNTAFSIGLPYLSFVFGPTRLKSARISAGARKLVTKVYKEVFPVKRNNMVIISTFLLSSTDKYISGIWRIVARLTGDQLKGIRGKIRITVRVGRTSVSKSVRYSQATCRISFLKRTTFIYWTF